MKRGDRDEGGSRAASAASLTPMAERIGRALRGNVTLRAAALEAARRARSALAARRERARLAPPSAAPAPARLAREFASLSPAELLAHFRTRRAPKFFAGFEEAAPRRADDEEAAPRRPDYFATRANDVEQLAGRAREIAEAHRWPLLGYGPVEFGAEPDWLADPISKKSWPLDFHRDVQLVRNDGSDVRVLWELNRLAHLCVLARAHAATGDPSFALECFRQLRHWRACNPSGYGPNWACAMEVALRALNLLAAFSLLARSSATTDADLSFMLALFDEHGRHVRRNLEFSHIATSNHYLSDVVGLLWLGVCLPELEAAGRWRAWALREMLGEMDKQVLADGAHCEASTGYHRFVTELFLHSFLLCRANGIGIEDRHWRRLRSMLEYVRAYLRPDGRAPLVGDSDGGRALPLSTRAADEHAYLLAVGAAAFDEPAFKVEEEAPEELFWLTGAEGVRAFGSMRPRPDARTPGDASRGDGSNGDESSADESRGSVSRLSAPSRSRAFPRAGTYVMGEGDLYLMLMACGAGLRGRGSHGHNDSLSIELSAHGTCFLRDPGTYVYTADREARHDFRSTAYHSTVEVDGAEQNTTRRETPFVIGNEAEPRVLRWETDDTRDTVVAEHDGYRRLGAGPITHRRTVVFDKGARLWLVEDELTGEGEHLFRFRFHAAPGVEARARGRGAELCHAATSARLLVVPVTGLDEPPVVEPRWSSRDYCQRAPSQSLCWQLRASAPLRATFALVPLRPGEDEAAKLKTLAVNC